jgi:hypothetical protein
MGGIFTDDGFDNYEDSPDPSVPTYREFLESLGIPVGDDGLVWAADVVKFIEDCVKRHPK